MWSCRAWAETMTFLMSCALSGISSPRAFSTARTEAMAWTVVHTPQMRWVNRYASRGSRPCKMSSMPRHIWPDDQELRTLPPSTSTSMRRWPSMRVIGSIVMRCAMVRSLSSRADLGSSFRFGRARDGSSPRASSITGGRLTGEDRESLDDPEVAEDLGGDEAERHQQLGDRRHVRPVVARVEGAEVRVEAEQRSPHDHPQRGLEQDARVAAPGLGQEQHDRQHRQRDLEPEPEGVRGRLEGGRQDSANHHVDQPDRQPQADGDRRGTGQRAEHGVSCRRLKTLDESSDSMATTP